MSHPNLCSRMTPPLAGVLGLVGMLVAGCAASERGGPAEPGQLGQGLAALVEVNGCDELLATLRERTRIEMEERVAENLQIALEGGWCIMYAEDAEGGEGELNGGGELREHSETNSQEQGVDEADIIETDGDYLYLLAQGQFQILDAWPAEQTRRVSATAIEGTAKRMFVDRDRAFIYSSLEPVAQHQERYDPWGWGRGYGSDGDCTYGYDCDFTGDGRQLKITILDLSDRERPVLLRETRFSGSYINARRVGQAVYTVVSFPEVALPGLRYWPEELDWCGSQPEEEIRGQFARLLAENRLRLAEADITAWLPGIQDTRYVEGEAHTETGLLSSCQNFWESRVPDGDAFLSVVSQELGGLTGIATTTVIGRPGAVYASGRALYVAARHRSAMGQPWFFDEAAGQDEASTVHRFELLTGPPRSRYVGSGAVKGRVLNQFAMSEYQGRLRIATTTGHLPDPATHSTVSVLEPRDGRLEVIGQVDQLAPSEDIRSARFDGDRGFIVTFKKTDPLFVLDLREPTRPRIAGELKIPGYSTYMHLIDPDHILSIGYDADDQGDFAWFQGILLQIFDVADMSRPALVHRTVIGTRGSTSEAATNHLAFNYFASRKLLAIPMAICEGGSGGSYGDRLTFSGLLVYDIDLAEGITERGRVAHEEPDGPEASGRCNSWWTDSNSKVQRSAFIEDYVYSVSDDQVKVNQIDRLAEELVSIDLGVEE